MSGIERAYQQAQQCECMAYHLDCLMLVFLFWPNTFVYLLSYPMALCVILLYFGRLFTSWYCVAYPCLALLLCCILCCISHHFFLTYADFLSAVLSAFPSAEVDLSCVIGHVLYAAPRLTVWSACKHSLMSTHHIYLMSANTNLMQVTNA
jgi:hypothetical protein